MRSAVLLSGCALSLAIVLWASADEKKPNRETSAKAKSLQRDRSPVDLVLGPDESWLITANQTADSVSLLRTTDGKVLAEITVGRRPTDIALSSDGRTVLVTCSYGGEVAMLTVADGALQKVASIPVGFEPYGVAISPNGKTAYVSMHMAGQIAVIDLASRKVTSQIDVGRWPRYMTLSPDGKRLAVGLNGERSVAVVDAVAGKLAFKLPMRGLNINHLCTSRDGKHFYFPWMMYGGNPPNAGSIRRGWVLGNRTSRVSFTDSKDKAGISLDPRGRAMGDPHGIDISPDAQTLVVSCAGSQELALFRLPELPLIGIGGSELMDRALSLSGTLYRRMPLGGRPMGLKISMDSKTAYVANYLLNAVQVVDLHERKITRTIDLGGPPQRSLARRGEAIFFDATRSLENWYSCHSCHFEGGSNAETMDTLNDGTSFSYKTVPLLYNVTRTGPWTWHGWQKDFSAAMHKSVTSTLAGGKPTNEDVHALVAYFKALETPPNPYLGGDSPISSEAERGKAVFHGKIAGCTDCHSGSNLTDGEIHDVGTGHKNDRYKGFNTPSLRNLYRRAEYLHDGRSDTLEELLTGPHKPASVTGEGELSDKQRADLIEYLKTL
jgi:YVTN family beta-propeller protein